MFERWMKLMKLVHTKATCFWEVCQDVLSNTTTQNSNKSMQKNKKSENVQWLSWDSEGKGFQIATVLLNPLENFGSISKIFLGEWGEGFLESVDILLLLFSRVLWCVTQSIQTPVFVPGDTKAKGRWICTFADVGLESQERQQRTKWTTKPPCFMESKEIPMCENVFPPVFCCWGGEEKNQSSLPLLDFCWYLNPLLSPVFIWGKDVSNTFAQNRNPSRLHLKKSEKHAWL